MNIAFRVDSSNLIGAGHVRRCIKLAEDLKQNSKKIIFITKNLDGNFNSLIRKKNFKVALISNNKKKNKLKSDFEDTKYICKKFMINTLIIDHYFLGLSWEKKIKEHINKLVVIDDFSSKTHCCNLVINNIGNKNNKKMKNLTGIDYIIVPNNHSLKKNKTITKKNFFTIGTFFGSTDKKNCSQRLLGRLAQKKFQSFKFISILGKNNKNKKTIENDFKKFKNIHIEKKFINMKYFFQKIDALITVGGITSFEALHNNIKCIYIPIGYYQKTTCNFLKKNKFSNILNYSKVFSKNGEKLLINCFDKISKEKNYLKNKLYLDGNGSKRIANYILGKEFNKKIVVN